jgi:hypothetical protein
MIIGYQFDADGQLVGYDETMEGLQADLLSADHPAVAASLLARERASAQRRTVVFANTVRERIAASKHYLQAARWSIQLASAQAVKAGVPTDFDTSVLEREARLRGLGETIEQLADKVLANSLVFASVGAAVDGIERATLDRIAACTELAGFEVILTEAKATALAEFLDIFTPVVGAEDAQARAAQFFGA